MTKPEISVVIPVYNDWESLAACLTALASQRDPPMFEVLIIDDGSTQRPPNELRSFSKSLQLKFAEQPHLGVSAARNLGLSLAAARTVLFVDADCKVHPSCLTALHEFVSKHTNEPWFQLQIQGDKSSAVGRAEFLHLAAIQEHMLLPNGSIRWLNTAGFAVQRESVPWNSELFDTRALRAQDTLLLARLAQKNQLPRFVPNALVTHAVTLSLTQYILKGFRTAYCEMQTYKLMEQQAGLIRSNSSDRTVILRRMWTNSHDEQIGKAALLLLLARHMSKLLGKIAFRLRPR